MIAVAVVDFKGLVRLIVAARDMQIVAARLFDLSMMRRYGDRSREAKE